MSERRRSSLRPADRRSRSSRGSVAVVADQADQARPRPAGRRPARLPGASRPPQQPTVDADAHAAVDRPHAAARQRVRRLRGRAQPGRLRPDRGQPAGRQGRRARRRSRSARPPSCSSTTGKPTSSTTKCKTNPDTNANSGSSRSSASTTAVKQASKCTSVGIGEGSTAARRRRRPPPSRASTPSTRSPSKPFANGQTVRVARRRRSTSLTDGAEGERRGHRGPGRRARPARREGQRRRDADPDRWWVIQRPPGPLGHGHQGPGAELRPARRQRADRHVQLHGQGPQGVPGDHAHGRRSAAPTTRSAATRSRRSQHFAIALDNELVSAPYINWRENPDGIDGSTGAQISGGFTIQTRAGPGEDPQDRRAAAEARRWSRARRSPPRSASRRSTRA